MESFHLLNYSIKKYKLLVQGNAVTFTCRFGRISLKRYLSKERIFFSPQKAAPVIKITKKLKTKQQQQNTKKNKMKQKCPKPNMQYLTFFGSFVFCLFTLWTWFSPNVCLYKTHKSTLRTAVNFFPCLSFSWIPSYFIFLLSMTNSYTLFYPVLYLYLFPKRGRVS